LQLSRVGIESLQCGFGVSPQADNEPWPDNLKLLVQIAAAVLLLVGARLPGATVLPV